MSCNVDLEQLITDTNRSIATLAITTLLKTGAEASIDRLMKQISSFVSDISDEFKIVVIEAIRSLCMRYPRKHATMMNFLATMLRDEGGFDYKKSIVDTIITIIEENPEAKEIGMFANATAECTPTLRTFSSLRVHRGLRAHRAVHPRSSSARMRGPSYPKPRSLHSIHLQPRYSRGHASA